MHRQRRVLGDQLVVDVVEPVLRVVQQDQAGRAEARHLARQLGADRAARTRHEHALAVQELGHLGQVQVHGLAPQQVLDAHVAHLGERRAAVLQVGKPGQRLHPDVRLDAEARDLAHHLRRQVRVRDDHDLDPLLLDHARQVGDAAEHLHALDQVAGEARIVVDEADRLQDLVARGPAAHLGDQVHARVPRAHDDRAPGPQRHRPQHALAREPPREAHTAHEHDLPQPDEHDEAAREEQVVARRG